MNRRDLIKKTLAMAAIPCCRTEQLQSSSFHVAGNLLTIDLRKTPTLRKQGGAVNVVDLVRDINLIVVHPDRGRYAALQRSCTHGGAQVAYSRHNRTVQCTSWGHSEFELDGTVLGGSAKKPLPVYEARRVGKRLEIALEAAS